MKLTIEVTQEDIDLGCKQETKACMVWRAVNRCTEGSLENLSVGYGYIDWRTGFAKLPGDVVHKILAWDSGFKTQPFSFELEIPEQYQGG